MKALDFLKDIRRDCPEEWKALDESIEELEQLIKENGELLGLQHKKIIELKNRSCDGCINRDEHTLIRNFGCYQCNRYYSDMYETKDKE